MLFFKYAQLYSIHQGAVVNGLKGRQQHLKFQEPDEELYSIFDVVKTIFLV